MFKRSVAGVRGMALAIATGAALSPAAADEARYEMSYYLERPGGEEIAAGNYSAAIAAANRGPRYGSEAALVAATNLCVAYTVTRELDRAVEACDAAVARARRSDGRHLRSKESGERAKALNNRGVLRALRGDALGSAADLRRAAKGAGRWDAPERNLAVIDAAADRAALARTAGRD